MEQDKTDRPKENQQERLNLAHDLVTQSSHGGVHRSIKLRVRTRQLRP